MTPLRILVVDDDADVRSVCKAGLGRRGHDVEVASSGTHGVERARSSSFDVVVLDQRMPGMSGIEAAGALREAGYAGALLLFSGYLDDEARDRAAALGTPTLDKGDIGLLVETVEGLAAGGVDGPR